MENVWVLFFHLMKHGTNILHVVFIFLFSIHTHTLLMYLDVERTGGRRTVAGHPPHQSACLHTLGAWGDTEERLT